MAEKNIPSYHPPLPEECPYGNGCYRQNPQHFEDYSHPKGHKRTASTMDDERKIELLEESEVSIIPMASTSTSTSDQTVVKKPRVARQDSAASGDDVIVSHPTNGNTFKNSMGLFLTTSKGIDAHFNDPSWTRDMKSILSLEMGNLQTSVQFNYMFDIPWIVDQYPEQFRTKPLLIVHGDRSESASGKELRREALLFPNITLAQVFLPIAYGTHHTKMMLLSYDIGMRVVIHTCNLIPNDWHMKTQGMWISPVFPKIDSSTSGDSDTCFRADLIEYLKSYNVPTISKLADSLMNFDMSAARVCLVASSPGRHTGPAKNRFGHLKLRSLLTKHCQPVKMDTDNNGRTDDWHEWPIIGQFSSIGSLGPNAESWLTGEWLESLIYPVSGPAPFSRRPALNLIFPSVDNVRFSLEGWRGGGSLPYSEATAQKQLYLNKFLHLWKSESKGRDHSMPHVKTYSRVSPDLQLCAWLLVTSANLSKAAWGALEKSSSQLMIRSYELGVLFLPKFYHPSATSFTLLHDFDSPVIDHPNSSIFLPYDLPLEEYAKTDKPWTWDGVMTGLKDRFGANRR